MDVTREQAGQGVRGRKGVVYEFQSKEEKKLDITRLIDLNVSRMHTWIIFVYSRVDEPYVLGETVHIQ
jgi:hypothetical protein